jgi:ferredoxin/flavodoxin---NADP+ reductase
VRRAFDRLITAALLEARGFEEGNSGEPGDYLIEKAFAQK